MSYVNETAQRDIAAAGAAYIAALTAVVDRDRPACPMRTAEIFALAVQGLVVTANDQFPDDDRLVVGGIGAGLGAVLGAMDPDGSARTLTLLSRAMATAEVAARRDAIPTAPPV